MATVRRATRADVPAMAGALADAFDDDPVMGWMLGPKPKQKRLVRFFSVALRSWFLRHEHTWTADINGGDVGKGAVAGGAVWAPPGRWRLGFLDMLLTAPTMMRLAAHASAASRPASGFSSSTTCAAPHYYLAILGTDPQKQGKGFASAMLAPVLARCDEEGMPAYLESSKHSNISFYERHGFVLNEELQLPNGPPIWPMLPRASRLIPPVLDHALTEPVEAFIADVTADVRRLSESLPNVKVDQLERDVAIEAYNLVAAFIDADSRHSDDELWALLTTFGPRLDTILVYATPKDLRESGLLNGRSAWLEEADSAVRHPGQERRARTLEGVGTPLPRPRHGHRAHCVLARRLPR